MANLIKNLFIPQSVKNMKHYMVSQFYHQFYGRPSDHMNIIGVTGTDGKTTTCTLIYEILKQAGRPTGMITTINARIGDKEYSTGFHVTTPDPGALQKFLREMVDHGLHFAVLETTSHGIDQYRIGGIRYGSATFTNVSHEHLDYHKTYDEYLKTKSKLINLVKPDGFTVINQDDRSFEYLYNASRRRDLKTFTYGFTQMSDFYATNLEDSTVKTSFTVKHKEHQFDVELHLPGEYNVYNALGAIGVALELGIDKKDIQNALSKVQTLEGRWEIIQNKPYKVVVDFAHTPNALDKMLQYARHDNKDGKLIAVFGAAGKRDHEKRPLMGEAAGKYADVVILTAEDPRGENIENINRQIAIGLKVHNLIENEQYFSIQDRRSAIKKALEIAKEGDTIIISGKGHEKSINLDGQIELPWSDQMTVKELLGINSK